MKRALLIVNIFLVLALLFFVSNMVLPFWDLKDEDGANFQYMVATDSEGPAKIYDICSELDTKCYLVGQYEEDLPVTEMILLTSKDKEAPRVYFTGKKLKLDSRFCYDYERRVTDGRYSFYSYGSEFNYICPSFISIWTEIEEIFRVRFY